MSPATVTPSEPLQQIVACSRDLYTLPRVAMQVLELTNQANVDIPALRKCVELDPALTSKVLRVVNSSLFGLPRSVGDLNHALTLLGVKPLKMLMLGFSLPPNLFEGLENEVLQQYWRRAIIKAVAAREIARLWGKTDSEEALICGLLQDIGILVLLQQLGEPYCRFVKQLWEAGNQVTLQERELFGFDHTEITSRLLSVWGLPSQLAAAVCAPRSLTAANSAATTVLWLAELTTSFLTSGDAEQLAALYQSLATWKQVPAERVEQFLIELQVKVEQLAAAFIQHPVPEGDYAHLVDEAQQRLAAESRSLSDVLAIRARELPIDRSQWRELLEALENLPLRVDHAAEEFDPVSGRERPEDALLHQPLIAPVEVPPLAETPLSTDAAALNSLLAATAGKRTAFLSPLDDAPFLRQVTYAAACCRAKRCGLSLLLVECDRIDEILLTRGVSFPAQLCDDAQYRVAQWLDAPVEAIPLGDSGFALLLHDLERLAAVQVARRLMDAAIRQTGRQQHQSAVTLSMGLAAIGLPPKNFAARNLVEAAQRCLEGARLSGGACLKSIEIY